MIARSKTSSACAWGARASTRVTSVSVSGPEKTRGGTGFGLETEAVRELLREVFARTPRAPAFHFNCHANMASTIAPKTANATQEEPVAWTRTFGRPARN